MTLSEAKLRCLAEAAALGSMRAASEKLDVAVSSISRQIAQLEATVGLPLIEHGRRTIKLTEAGEIAVRFYRQSMAHREAFGSSLQALRGLHAGEIQLATGEGLVSALSAMVQKFLARHAGVLLTVSTAGTLEVIRQVRDDEAHLGLVFQAPVDPKISVRASVPQPIKLIANPRHPLAGERSVTLRQICEHRLCLPEATFRIRQMISLAESHENVSLKPDVNSNSLYLLKQLVKSGGYVTLLPEAAAIVEINRRELVSVASDSRPLQDTSLNLISRLGRTLPVAPAAFLPILESGMRTWLTNPRPAPEQR